MTKNEIQNFRKPTEDESIKVYSHLNNEMSKSIHLDISQILFYIAWFIIITVCLSIGIKQKIDDLITISVILILITVLVTLLVAIGIKNTRALLNEIKANNYLMIECRIYDKKTFIYYKCG